MRYEEWYGKISAPFQKPPARTVVVALDRALVAAFAMTFAGVLVWLIATLDMRAVRFAIVPAIVYAVVTVLRAKIDAPRPYEAAHIWPVVVKDTRGKSMPSRHMASATVIAFALAWLNPAWGALAFAGCACVAFTRIVGGVHFPRDIAVAAAIAAVFGVVGFFAIP